MISNLLGIRPYNLSLYVLALTHKSVSTENSQERLEHLGDSILGACVTAILYRKYPYENEGSLTQYKSKIVNSTSLAEIGRRLGLAQYIIIDPVHAEALNHDRVYEDTVEALIGAIFIDRGFDDSYIFVQKLISEHLSLEEITKDTNYKELVRRYAMRKKLKQAQYKTHIDDKGVSCELTFWEDVDIKTIGYGDNKKKAEMDAAKKLLHILGYEEGPMQTQPKN